VDNYTALLFQPQGDIEADHQGVRHAYAAAASIQFSSFLSMAAGNQADLVICPEYSMPWQVVERALQQGTTPSAGALWVLGCESITSQELDAFRARVAGIVPVFYEPVAPQAGRFFNPVIYIFVAPTTANPDTSQVVIVAQFKSSPMGDKEHYEINNLHLGTRLYVFGGGTAQLRLATLICSDAFAVTDQLALDLYHRTLLIHIQLNKSPRQAQYRLYRDKLLQYGGGETEILCLNWAKGVNIVSSGQPIPWTEITGSAWYLCPDKFAIDDTTISNNHKNGLYYTWLDDLRCHALYFSYCPAVFSITATKVAHHGVIASQSVRRGPIVTSTHAWNAVTSRWDVAKMSDGFSAVVVGCGHAANDIAAIAQNRPLCAERALALCAGAVPTVDWHSVKRLDSCLVDKSEVVLRITACQDTHLDAQRFRTLRLRSAHRVMSVLRGQLPAALADLAVGFKIDWTPQSPHTNILSTTVDGSARRATVIYLSDQHTEQSAHQIADVVADHIGQWSTNPDQMVEGKQRICVWFRDDLGNDTSLPNPYMEYDEPHTDSPFDFGREA
jgi:hypothetical protein